MFAPTNNPYKFQYLVTGIDGPGIEQVYLPECPPDDEILFKDEQKFTKPVLSEELKEWIAEVDFERNRKNKAGQYINPKYTHPEHQAEIDAYEDMQWERGENGLWFWNNGVKTYITNDHYRYLTEWHPDFEPEFRVTDMETWYWVKFWEEDPLSYGGCLNTLRREGKSAKMGFWITNRTISDFKHFSGMQGEDNLKIQAFYQQHILSAFHKLPSYRQPVFDTNTLQAKGIIFNEPPRRTVRRGSTGRTVLESKMDYRTSEENKYDQAKLHSYVMEEAGKCHPAGTMVRMYDGTLKDVINVREGDQLRGTDNEPRIVKKLGSGFGKIYKIIPNSKAEPWYVNEYHILSCKSSSRHHTGYKKGTTINLSVQEYLQLTPSLRKNLMCYRVGVEYPAREHKIDAYLLGLWLGDGTSAAGEITNVDQEISDWLYSNWPKINKKTPKNRTASYYLYGLTTILKSQRLFKNKHIPSEYLLDSRSNRLKLLAGLIDTDGHKNKREDRRHYEIVQKNKALADGIIELVNSLGFYAGVEHKVATMKRKDGTIYRCPVYRIGIYGWNLHEIPCQIKRKQIPSDITTYNSKDPLVYGFSVEYDRDDWYYGFNITGNRLYLLKDYTVTHNTLVANVWDRWGFVKPALTLGATIIGKSFIGTTVEYMDTAGKGGKAYMRLCLASNYNQRNKNNQTTSGLYAAMMPADCAMEGMFDEWGHPKRKEAMEWILNGRADLEDNPKDYAALVRKYPTNWEEVFYVSAESCEFNIKILQARNSEVKIHPPATRRFVLEWENGVRFSKVVMTDSPTGWFHTTKVFTGDEADWYNAVTKRVENSTILYSPSNDHRFAIGIDPIEHGVVVESTLGENGFVTTRQSRPVLVVKRKYDSAIDGPSNMDILKLRAKEKYPYKTGVYFAWMHQRPSDPNVFFERCLMVCWLHATTAQIESQKPGVINWFNNTGSMPENGQPAVSCREFTWMKYVADPAKQKPTDLQTQGTAATPSIIQEYTGMLATDVEYFGHTYPTDLMTQDLISFDPRDTKPYDFAVAMGNCEIGTKMRPRRPQQPERQINQYFRRFDKQGRVIKMKAS